MTATLGLLAPSRLRLSQEPRLHRRLGPARADVVDGCKQGDRDQDEANRKHNSRDLTASYTLALRWRSNDWYWWHCRWWQLRRGWLGWLGQLRAHWWVRRLERRCRHLGWTWRVWRRMHVVAAAGTVAALSGGLATIEGDANVEACAAATPVGAAQWGRIARARRRRVWRWAWWRSGWRWCGRRWSGGRHWRRRGLWWRVDGMTAASARAALGRRLAAIEGVPHSKACAACIQSALVGAACREGWRRRWWW